MSRSRDASASPTDSELECEACARPAEWGTTLKLIAVITASVPNEPIISLPISRPATFFTTMPPDCTSRPLSVANCIPITRSRAVPYWRRRGPLMFAPTTPPMVAAAAKGRIERHHLLIRRQRLLQAAIGHTGFHADGEIARLIVQQAIQAARSRW